MQGILPGYNWSEHQMGPNGVGTCLALRRSLILTGVQHFELQKGPVTSVAVPIFRLDHLVGAFELRLETVDCTIDRVGPVLAGAHALGSD